MIQAQYSHSIKVFRSDNDGEFVNTAMSQYFVEKLVLYRLHVLKRQNKMVRQKEKIGIS